MKGGFWTVFKVQIRGFFVASPANLMANEALGSADGSAVVSVSQSSDASKGFSSEASLRAYTAASSSPSSTRTDASIEDASDASLSRPAFDMDSLKALVLAAPPGDVGRVIREAQFSPRHNAFTSLLQLVGKARQPEKADEVFRAMTEVSGIMPNAYSYSAVMTAMGRTGRWQQAESYFEEQRRHAERNPELAPNTVTFAALISAYIKGGQLDRALEAFRMQQELGPEPDIITYSSLINACERASEDNIKVALDLVDCMHAQGLAGGISLYNSLLASCAYDWRAATELFLGMQCAGVEPSPQSLDLVIRSLAVLGRRKQAQHVQQAPMPCISATVEMAQQEGDLGMRIEHGLCALRQAAELGWPPSHAAFSGLLMLCSTAGNLAAAEEVVERMAAAGMRADPGTVAAGGGKTGGGGGGEGRACRSAAR